MLRWAERERNNSEGTERGGGMQEEGSEAHRMRCF
jgi:hypothetical protein